MVSDAVIGSVQGRTAATGAQQPNDINNRVNDQNRSPALQGAEERQEVIRPEGTTSVVQTQGSETNNNGQENPVQQRVQNENSSAVQFTGSESRGSVVDLSV